MATSTVKSNVKDESLPERHVRLIQEYTRKSGAAKAAIARRIHEVQVDLRLSEVEYQPWQKPGAVRTNYDLGPEQLRTQTHALQGMVADEPVEEPTRDAAQRRLVSSMSRPRSAESSSRDPRACARVAVR